MQQLRVRSASPRERSSLTATLLHFALLLAAWILAWLLYRRLAAQWPILAPDQAAASLYWLAAKLLIWLAPCLLLTDHARLAELFALHRRDLRSGLLWGGAASAAILVLNLGFLFLSPAIDRHAALQRAFAPGLLPLLSSMLAPLTEELLLRGYFQWRLMQALRPAAAVVISAGLFLLLHLPGWYFQGQLQSPASLLRLAAGVAAVGLLCAWLRLRSGSLLAPLLAHWVNNLCSLFWR